MSAAFLLVAICVWGCGGSSSSTRSQTAPGVPHAAEAPGSINKARATAYAREVNLVPADVPGAEVTSQERESPPPSHAAFEYAHCSGGPSPDHRVVDIKSPTFKLGPAPLATSVKSSVEVRPSAAFAAKSYAAARSARSRVCLTRMLPQLFASKSSGVHFEHAAVAFLPNLLHGGQNSFGVRVTVIASGKSRGGKDVRVRSYLDLFDILNGPAEVSLTVSSFSLPTPTAIERGLLSRLYDRTGAHKL
jgi:hypothetical protein